MSMNYRVKLTNYAIEQLQEIVFYISKVLLSPDTAQSWSDKIMEELYSLDDLPSRYKLVEEEPWHSFGVHKMVIQNFIAYYWIDETNTTVWITGVIYEKQNQVAALRRMPMI